MSAKGDIMLGYGQHEVVITVPDGPVNVAFSIHDPCQGCPPCHTGDINKVGVHILDNGFVLYADIRSNTACVEWFVK